MLKQVHKLLLFLALLWALAPASTQAQVINCPSGFASTGDCGVGIIAGGQAFELAGSQNGSSPALNGSQVLLLSNGATHAALSLNYQTQVDDQAFTASFTFIPNGQNIAFVIQNSNNNPYFNGSVFSAGAGCEAGFFQAYSQPQAPNNVFALELDSYSPLTANESFTYSSAQIYQSGQSPCIPSIQGYPVIDKISTSPVPLNSPADSQDTSTGDTYSATVTYDGSNLTLKLYDVTAGGSCPGSSCFTNTWTNVDIPSSVGGNMAWVGLTGATGLPGSYPLYIKSFVYNGGTPTSSTPTPTPTPAPAGCTVSITSPANGATVSGVISVTDSSTCTGDYSKWYLPNAPVNGSCSQGRYDTPSGLCVVFGSGSGSFNYDTTTLSNGSNGFYVQEFTPSAKLNAATGVSVTVQNGAPAPTPAPAGCTVSITNPANGAMVSGVISVTDSSTCTGDFSKWYLPNAPVNGSCSQGQFDTPSGLCVLFGSGSGSFNYDTTTLSNGASGFYVQEFTSSGYRLNAGTGVSVTVQNGAPHF